MARLVFYSLILFILSSNLRAQDSIPNSRLAFNGYWRNYYLHTFNKGQLKDFNALATGGKIGLGIQVKKRWQINGSLFLSYNTQISDINRPDPQTARISRYEAGLFDLQNLDEPLTAILGELNIRFGNTNHFIKLGRFKINSPLINPQDGRMIPTLEQGIWYKNGTGKRINGQFILLNAIAPRSSGQFFDIGKSIGVYPTGRQENDKPSYYENQIDADFIAIGNVDLMPLNSLKIEIWNYFIDNTFYNFYARPVLNMDKKGTVLKLEYNYQARLNNGGNEVDSLRYFENAESQLLGIQFGFKTGKSSLKISYNHIFDGGRFLFPREWGREELFSFQKRERSEGSANNHAMVLYYEYPLVWNTSSLNTIASIGHHWKADVINAADNKYAIPSYTHFNLDLFYKNEKLKNLQPELLLSYKLGSGNYAYNPNFVQDKVDMFQINLIVNYLF